MYSASIRKKIWGVVCETNMGLENYHMFSRKYILKKVHFFQPAMLVCQRLVYLHGFCVTTDLEDHPNKSKCLGSPSSLSHENKKAIWKGVYSNPIILRGLINGLTMVLVDPPSTYPTGFLLIDQDHLLGPKNWVIHTELPPMSCDLQLSGRRFKLSRPGAGRCLVVSETYRGFFFEVPSKKHRKVRKKSLKGAKEAPKKKTLEKWLPKKRQRYQTDAQMEMRANVGPKMWRVVAPTNQFKKPAVKVSRKATRLVLNMLYSSPGERPVAKEAKLGAGGYESTRASLLVNVTVLHLYDVCSTCKDKNRAKKAPDAKK